MKYSSYKVKKVRSFPVCRWWIPSPKIARWEGRYELTGRRYNEFREICSMVGLYRLWMTGGRETSRRSVFLREIQHIRVQHIALRPTGSAPGRPQPLLHGFVRDENLLHE